MKLVGSGNQRAQHFLYRADGVIANGGTPQLVLPVRPSCSSFVFQNTSGTNMYVEIGAGAATATVSNAGISGTITGFTIVNAGFNFTKPPIVRLIGGGAPPTQAGFSPGSTPGYTLPQTGFGAGPGAVNTAYVANSAFAAVPGMWSPAKPARVRAVLTSGAISSFTIDDPGLGYFTQPYVQIINSDLDPYGCAVPSATSGYLVEASGGSLTFNGTVAPTEAVAVFCSASSATFLCRYTD